MADIPPPWPTKRGARCADCGGPVTAFGCAARCKESQRHRVDWIRASPDPRGTQEMLEAIRSLAEAKIRGTRAEFLDPEWVIIYQLAGGKA